MNGSEVGTGKHGRGREVAISGSSTVVVALTQRTIKCNTNIRY